MIYSMEPMDDEGAKEAQTDKDPLHIPGPESGPGAAAVVLQAVRLEITVKDANG